MIQEDKELLLKDLCARLPYGVWVQIIDGMKVVNNKVDKSPYNRILFPHELELFWFHKDYNIKPYLRPMSSMTEEEQKELRILQESFDFNCYAAGDYSFQLNLAVTIWYLEHHLDFIGLIPKGLAIEVTEDNNPYENGL